MIGKITRVGADKHGCLVARAALSRGNHRKQDQLPRLYSKHERQPRQAGPERLRQLQEAVQVILAMWTQEEATFEGNYYQIRGAMNQPKGVQQPHIPMMIAGGGEQVTLKLVAQYGDACNLISDPATLEHKLAVLEQHCKAVGRDHESIHRTALTLCIIGETDEQARAQIPGWTVSFSPEMLGHMVSLAPSRPSASV